VRQGWDSRLKRGEHLMSALQDSVDDAFNARIGDVSGRGKLGTDMREIWTMQPRFEKRVGSGPYTLLDHPRFRAGFDFMRLRAQIGEIDPALADWWETFSTAYDDERHAMIEAVREAQLQKPQQPRVRVKRPAADAVKPSGAEAARAAPEDAEAFQEDGDAAPAKKRRRRRKPTNRAATEGGEGGNDAPSSGAASNP
jgi:poly(A) polymerase